MALLLRLNQLRLQAMPERWGLDEIETANIRFGYCTEFIVMLEKPFDEKDDEEFKAFLSSVEILLYVLPTAIS